MANRSLKYVALVSSCLIGHFYLNLRCVPRGPLVCFCVANWPFQMSFSYLKAYFSLVD